MAGMIRIYEGQPGFGQGAGRMEKEKTGEMYRGPTTNMVGCVICCVTCCPCGFCIPMDPMERSVWVVQAAPQVQVMGVATPVAPVVGALAAPPPGVISAMCGGACGKIIKVQPQGPGVIQFQCPHCQAVNQIQYQPGGEEAPKAPPPSWWLTKPAFGDSQLVPVSNDIFLRIEQMMDNTWKDVTTRDRGYKKPQKFRVAQVLQNCNPKLWHNYCSAKNKIRAKMGNSQLYDSPTRIYADSLGAVDRDVNECLLFHGTKPGACDSICKSDFMVKMAGSSTGTLYGGGIYFGENSSKSDEYCTEGDGIYVGQYAMLLCRVSMGRVQYNDQVTPNAAALESACKAGQFDSVLGDREKARGTYREFIVFNNDQAYPEYVVLYRRVDA